MITHTSTSSADTIDTSNLTATANAVISIDAGVCTVVITLGAKDVTLLVAVNGEDSGASVATDGSITGFTMTTVATTGAEDVDDVIDINGGTAAIGMTITDANVSAVSAAGKITFSDATLTLAELILDAATVSAASAEAAFFVNDDYT